MPAPQNDTGFDAFFQAITTSPEFRWIATKDWKWDSMEALEKSLLDMQTWVEKASGIMKSFDSQFANPLSKEGDSPKWNWYESRDSISWTPPKTWNPWDPNAIPPLEVQRFTRMEGKPFGFEAVAGMDTLKIELQESFIKPLRFKFLVEKLKKQQSSNWWKKENGGSEVETVWVRSRTDDWWAERTSFSTPETFDTEGEFEWNEKRNSPGGFGHTSIWTIDSHNWLLLKLYTEYEKFKISIPTGMLFYGPPGTGKTFITKKLAEELGCGFISKNMGEFGSSYLHQTTKNIKDFFTWAKKVAESEPIILFLDEIDSLVSARTNNIDANKAEEVSQFLQEFNALEDAPNLIVIAATNRPDHLDPAILRSWRLDKKIYLGPPDDIARKALFQMYIEKAWRPHEVLDYDELAKLTEWYVSADIEAICDEVARDASRDLLDLVDEAESGTLTEEDLDGHMITMDSLRDTVKETPSSLKMVDMSVYEKWLEKTLS